MKVSLQIKVRKQIKEDKISLSASYTVDNNNRIILFEKDTYLSYAIDSFRDSTQLLINTMKNHTVKKIMSLANQIMLKNLYTRILDRFRTECSNYSITIEELRYSYPVESNEIYYFEREIDNE